MNESYRRSYEPGVENLKAQPAGATEDSDHEKDGSALVVETVAEAVVRNSGMVVSAPAGTSPSAEMTFTDRDLYELMHEHMPYIFWAKWERLNPLLQHSVAGLANDIWERLK